MTDRELLELAAKAAEIEIQGWYGDDRETWADISEDRVERWNPLTDDGDALRLAVKIAVDGRCSGVEFFPKWVCVHHHNNRVGEKESEVYGTDPYAATRRAIVRAAAEIGKAK